MPTGVEVPHVGHRTAPGWRVSPQVEQRIRSYRRKTFSFDFRPYEASERKIQTLPSPELPYWMRTILIRRPACAALAAPASPPRRTVVDPASEGFTM